MGLLIFLTLLFAILGNSQPIKNSTSSLKRSPTVLHDLLLDRGGEISIPPTPPPAGQKAYVRHMSRLKWTRLGLLTLDEERLPISHGDYYYVEDVLVTGPEGLSTIDINLDYVQGVMGVIMQVSIKFTTGPQLNLTLAGVTENENQVFQACANIQCQNFGFVRSGLNHITLGANLTHFTFGQEGYDSKVLEQKFNFGDQPFVDTDPAWDRVILGCYHCADLAVIYEISSFTLNLGNNLNQLPHSEISQHRRLRPYGCGNGTITDNDGLQCEDGNSVEGDGCDYECAIEPGYECYGGSSSNPDTCSLYTCGQGRQPGGQFSNGYCDDGNFIDGDGCSSSCQVEDNYKCEQSLTDNSPSNCVTISTCSLSYFVAEHTLFPDYCNDGNTDDGDGCSSTCHKEFSSICDQFYGQYSYYFNCFVDICGDGLLVRTEVCDDGNTIDGDGCSSTCALETGFRCTGGTTSSPDVCSDYCGDGLVYGTVGPTYCDDGNGISGDGCDSTCTIETGYACSGGSTSIPDTCSDECGDGFVYGTVGPTYCDDGNNIDGDGCSSTCVIETGYTCSGGSTSSPNICVDSCGDGAVFGSVPADYCDDGNFVDGDGCSSTCQQEIGYECSGGTTTSPDSCTVVCGDGYLHSSEACDDGNILPNDGCSSLCVLEDPNKFECISDVTIIPATTCEEIEEDEEEGAVISFLTNSLALLILIMTGVVANFANSVISNKSPQGAWAMINQIQLFMLLPLLCIHMDTSARNYIMSNSFSLFNFDMVQVEVTDYEDFKNSLDLPQPNEYLDDLGLSSASSLINNLGFILTIVLTMAIHPLVLLTRMCKCDPKSCCGKLMDWIFYTFTFKTYIRMMLEAYLFLFLTTILELKDYFIKEKGNKTSVYISLGLAVYCALLILVVFIIWIVNRRIRVIKPSYYSSELFCGVKNGDTQKDKQKNRVFMNKYTNKYSKARLYSLIFLLRRALLVAIVAFVDELTAYGAISSTLVLQCIYIYILWNISSFESQKDQVVELINECIFTVLVLLLAFLTNEERWFTITTYIYILIMVGNTLMMTSIAVITLIDEIYRKLKLWRNKKSGENSQNQQQPQEQQHEHNIERPSTFNQTENYNFYSQNEPQHVQNESRLSHNASSLNLHTSSTNKTNLNHATRRDKSQTNISSSDQDQDLNMENYRVPKKQFLKVSGNIGKYKYRD